MANFMSGLISLAISIVIFAGVFVSSVKGQNQSGSPVIAGTANLNCTPGALVNCSYNAWTAGEVALWGTLTLVGIAGILYGTLNVFGLV